ncbi:substrate-binding domain-containing protein [Caproicibacterium sp. BJN0003]|uniref:substrate-binding domain-containing protein n=1 Tax=Caproicibacterium sp. BJN0003 TaxID=2994078 RepID=UPI00225234AB|nr:substrate-binding domain-containing protein [Caproicibacterium sp. BJN0003]UZT82352.1 substrate-binding domain-containing protein [Caproicibacterium sp. BJN0003]
MKKHRSLIIFSVILIFFLIFLAIISQGITFSQSQPEIRKISFLAGGKKGETWSKMEQGITQAASDYKVELTPVYLSKEDDVQEQIQMLEREVENGADAIVIAPVNSEDLEEPIRKAARSVPVVTIDSEIAGADDIPYIRCDNTALGETLSERMLNDPAKAEKPIALVSRNLSRTSCAERYQGAKSKLQEENVSFVEWPLPEDSTEAYNQLLTLLHGPSVSKVAAFDSDTSELVAKAEQELSPSGVTSVQIFGVGSTRQVVSYLEDHVISALGVQNEFNIGYLGLQKAVNILNKQSLQNTVIDYSIVNGEDLYTKENQRLLFPFSQ